MTYESVLAEIQRWPVEDQLRLVDDLNDRLSEESDDPELSEEFKAELDRRSRAMDDNPDRGIPWEVVRGEALKRLRR